MVKTTLLINDTEGKKSDAIEREKAKYLKVHLTFAHLGAIYELDATDREGENDEKM